MHQMGQRMRCGGRKRAESEREEEKAEILLRETMAESFPNFRKDMDLQIQEAQ